MNAFCRAKEAIEEIRSGRMIVLVDDADRENEGDLVLAAQFATPETINFMASHGRGLICLALRSQLVENLGLPLMTPKNEASYQTAFTVSVEAREGVTTGISAHDRAHTIQTCIKEKACRDDLVVPGHIFPLRAEEGGVLLRAGHTEASVDLARLAGLKEAAVICEVLKEDGSMARMPDLEVFAKEHGLKVFSIADLIEYRLRQDSCLVSEELEQSLEECLGYSANYREFVSELDGSRHSCFCFGSPEDIASSEVLVRVHAENDMKDYFLPLLQNKRSLFHKSMELLKSQRPSVLVLLRGLPQNIQSAEAKGERMDLKNYGLGAQILRSVGVKKMHLLTDNPKHLVAFEGFGIELLSQVPISQNPVFNSARGQNVSP